YRGGSQIGTTATTSYTDSTTTGSTTYSYTVAAYDGRGNTSAQSSPASVTTPPIPDTTPPSVPTRLSGTSDSPTHVNRTWSASYDADGCGVAGYPVFRGGVQIGSTSSTTYSDTGLSELTTYTYSVSAYDCFPNESAQSSGVPVQTPMTVPTVPTGLAG